MTSFTSLVPPTFHYIAFPSAPSFPRFIGFISSSSSARENLRVRDSSSCSCACAMSTRPHAIKKSLTVSFRRAQSVRRDRSFEWEHLRCVWFRRRVVVSSVVRACCDRLVVPFVRYVVRGRVRVCNIKISSGACAKMLYAKRFYSDYNLCVFVCLARDSFATCCCSVCARDAFTWA